MANLKSFSLGRTLSEGWNILWGSGSFGAFSVVVLANFVTSYLAAVSEEAVFMTSLAVIVVSGALAAAIYASVVLRSLADKIGSSSDIVQRDRIAIGDGFGAIFLANLFVGPLFVLATILLIIPGIFVYSLFFFLEVVIILERLSAFEGMGRSIELGRGYRLEIFFVAAIISTLQLGVSWLVESYVSGTSWLYYVLEAFSGGIFAYWALGAALSGYLQLSSASSE